MGFKLDNYNQIKDIIAKNSQKDTKIIAISKNHPLKSVMEAANHGITVFGENRVQEAKTKFDIIKNKFPNIELHLTGPLQTNKVKDALKIFDVFHTLDREKLAKEFHKFQEKIIEKKFFIQINTGKETTKSGIYPELAKDFIDYCKKEISLNVIGLMCIPPIQDDPKEHFLFLEEIAKLNHLKHLSMGMSGDFREAIEVGSTHIRVGTFLFGTRNV